MLTREDYLMISEQRRQGVFIKDIAAELGVHPRTVRRALWAGRPGIDSAQSLQTLGAAGKPTSSRS